jgi:hypothetical protein
MDPAKIYRDLDEVVSKRTINLWIKMINNTSSINLLHSPGRPHTARTKANISRTSTHRILREDHGYFPYKKIKQPKLTDLQKQKNIKFANWVLNNYTKDDIKTLLLTDEFFFDLDGVYSRQNDRIWAVNREQANKKGVVQEKTKFPIKVMVWLGVCGQELTVPVILGDGTMDAEIYINEVLPIALKSDNKILGNYWTYQQDGATTYIHHMS